MNAIANLFLQAKHWQIFLLLFAAPTVIEVAAIGVVPERISSWHNLGPGEFILLGVTLLYFLCIVAWLGSMGLFFWSMVTPELRMETQFFRLSLVYPMVYFPIFLFSVIPGIPIPVAFILPLHLACMICLFYLLYFVSRNLVLLETGKPVSFYEYAGPFFLLWFFPIGVWFIQPKVNRLYAERSEAMKHVSLEVEAYRLTTDELLARMPKEQAIIQVQGILRLMESSMDVPDMAIAKTRMEKVLEELKRS